MTADTEVREIITRAGLGRTLFVEAGAGTGKTTQLVGRIASLVIDEGVPLAGIAAITFTEAAAAELSARIRVTFERREADSTDEEVRGRCRRALADADRAAISTLHSFANRILGEHTLAAGLPLRIGILDEISSELAHEERWSRFVDELYADPVHDELLVRAVLADAALEPRYRGHATEGRRRPPGPELGPARRPPAAHTGRCRRWSSGRSTGPLRRPRPGSRSAPTTTTTSTATWPGRSFRWCGGSWP